MAMSSGSGSGRARSVAFLVTGGVGGLAGFVLMEAVFGLTASAGATRSGNLLEMGIYFAGFGLAVGAALGMTEGLLRRNRYRLWYGLTVGLVLGGLGGFLGGVVGQLIYGLVPVRYAGHSTVDLVITLDSSGSMRRAFFFGSDPRGERKTAAKRLVDRLLSGDRVAVVDFDEQSRVLLPLTPVGEPDARRRARQAIDRVDDAGLTSLDAGLMASFDVLRPTQGDDRTKHIIFLTDGQGDYTPERFSREAVSGVTVHTVGLGDGVDASLLSAIASSTGGSYYPVGDASDLVAVFDRIYSEHVSMAVAAPDDGSGELLTPGWVLLLLRVLSWGVMGAVIGMGQGVTYNTREDLKACTLGGLVGGLIGGGLFDPVSQFADFGAASTGRAIADVVVGAAIGGSMKLAQGALVANSGRRSTALLYRPGMDLMDTGDESRGGRDLRTTSGKGITTATGKGITTAAESGRLRRGALADRARRKSLRAGPEE